MYKLRRKSLHRSELVKNLENALNENHELRLKLAALEKYVEQKTSLVKPATLSQLQQLDKHHGQTSHKTT